MAKVRTRGEQIRRFILEAVQKHPGDLTKVTTKRFGISRQAVNAHLAKLVAQGTLRMSGQTKARHYTLAPLHEWTKAYLLSSRPAEDLVWRDDVLPELGKLPDNVREIWAHGFTEMFNNAVDHSGGEHVFISIARSATATDMRIMDDGVGIFRKIQKALNLLDERHALFELTKGKLTTDPSRHTGEGIFFTSRMFDQFDILSGGVFFSHKFGNDEDWLLEREQPWSGTAVLLKLSNHTSRTTREVFDQFSSGPDDYAFSKTVVPVKLAQYGDDKLISRSQAKRVMARVELFKTVVLDFTDVPDIGQAFADELFRVFRNSHPGIEIVPINANADVSRAINRALA